MSDPIQTVGEPGREEASPVVAVSAPQRIGRYRVEKVLGQGGFGLVYLAHDEQLQRPVAIKVPHRKLVTRPEDAAAYLTEARTVANLDHPSIVPVYDVGSTEDRPCFVVSKYIDGADLKTKIKASRLSVAGSADLVATVAEALHYAHKQGLVHRDIKPGNILLDRSGKAFVADFGLALREQDVGRGPRYAGTPAYMSPEQARGEGHRVDGRSDIFSLGVVCYELLTGQRPFWAESRDELLDQITSQEARPPRQIDDTIPRELERICLKTLSKRASERYTTAKDLADDLRHFLAEASAEEKPTLTGRERHEAESATPLVSPVPTPSDQQAIKIVPKGLRSFDAGDADFFLELLPGARDRDGLPDGIRFWKTRIEETDSDSTFSVGLIYGPSGCGKSSLVKAGLLPRLARSVTAVYVEATGDGTEARLLKGLRRQVPETPGNLGLVESLAALRQGRFLEPGQKVLLVLDQFEQWLHAKRAEENAELVQALRQCDGGRVQGIVMVRDDFGMAATRFMAALDIPIVQGHNFATVDLFDPLHSRKVLAAFGRAYGRLPDNLGNCTKESDAFLDQAVAGLAQDGKVISVRLALFAEMVKGKPWTPTTLKEVGGTAGVGVTFLEETFAASTAPPQHRLHQKAAQAVLKALLPETGSDIKGHMRSQQELLNASGYGHRPKDFAELRLILDAELRLITPTDPEGKEDTDTSTLPAAGQYYQLTHDYLVPSLRDWLTRKQKETRRGRAELLLADRASVWNARPENRQLPSLLQWLQIRWLTRKTTWTPPQRKMMRRATRYHAVRGLMIVVLLALLTWGGYEAHGTLQAHALRGRLLDANTNEVPGIVKDMAPYRRWLDRLLHDAYAQAEKDHDRHRQLHSSLALVPVDATQVDYLYGRLLDAEPDEVPVIRDFLDAHKDALVEKLWAVLDEGKQKQRLRAAAALARYDREGQRWEGASGQVVADLVAENSLHLGIWSESLRPVKARLIAPLSDLFRDRKPERTAERTQAMNLLADYAADDPAVLTNLLLDADEKQFVVLYPKFTDQAAGGLPLLTAEIGKKLPPDLPSSDPQRETLAKRQANAAVALLRLNQADKVWPLLRRSDQPEDPRVRSYLIHRFGPLGTDARVLVQRLAEEPDVTIRRALLLSLGPEEFESEPGGVSPRNPLPPEEKKRLLGQVQDTYRTADDPGLHAAAEWLLRQWGQEAWLKQINEDWAGDKEQTAKRLDRIQQFLKKDKGRRLPQWYVNGEGQTMVVIPGPVEFAMGSPPTEEGRLPGESQHKRRIGRTFAVAAKLVTVAQFQRYWKETYRKDYDLVQKYVPDADCPVHETTWYMAAAYCNWLSQKEGLPECYEMKNGQVTQLKDDYLSLPGYRLPTEAEWEYACRAGTVTSRYYGETEELLSRYGWHVKNSQDRTWPVGGKKPNDWGLFDMHGNVYTWCQEGYREYPEPKGDESIEDKEGSLIISKEGGRMLRGGSFNYLPVLVRSAYRYRSVPVTRNLFVGFRPARTFTP